MNRIVPHFYIIGSKYGNQKDGFDDIFPEMVKRGVVATGFSWGEDLSHLIHKNKSEIVNYLKKKGEKSDSYSTLKYFLNLKPGDLIAVKRHSAPSGKKPRLLIGAYAVVKGIESPDYNECEKLGHVISVEYLETDVNYELVLGYGKTIHKIEDENRIDLIFGHYSQALLYKNDSCYLKNINDIPVKDRKGYLLSRSHNIIQNALVKKLEKQYGKEKVKVEFGCIDVMLQLEEKNIIYEVKSSMSVESCIRQALGQILSYGWRLGLEDKKSIEYVIVGSQKPNSKEQEFLNFIRKAIQLNFKYLSVNSE